MTYDLANEFDRARLKARFEKDLAHGAVIDYTEHKFKSSSQNRYLHALIGVAALEVGVSLEYAKNEYFKRLVNHDLFAVPFTDKLTGEEKEALRSITIIPMEDLAKAIDKFKRWMLAQNWAVPEPGDEAILRAIEIELGRNRYV